MAPGLSISTYGISLGSRGSYAGASGNVQIESYLGFAIIFYRAYHDIFMGRKKEKRL